MGRMGIEETPFISQSLRSTSKGTQGLGPLKMLSLRSKSQNEFLDRHIWIVPSKGACVEAQSLACGAIKRWITTGPTLPMGLSITEFILMGLPGGGPNGGSRPLGIIIEGWILLLSSYILSACLAPMEEVAFLHHTLSPRCSASLCLTVSQNLYSLGYFSQVICSNCDKKSHYHNSADHNWAG